MRGKRSRTARGNRLFRTSVMLLALALFSTMFMLGLYARYRTSGSGDDSARVIKFGELFVTETGNFTPNGNANSFIFTPGVSLKKAVRISFGGSESATYLFAVVTTTSNPETSTDLWKVSSDGLNYAFYVDSTEILSFSADLSQNTSTGKSWTYLPAGSGNGTYVYYMALNPNTQLQNQGLIANDTVTVSPTIPPKGYGDPALKNISVNVTAYVVQANGFDSVAAAWASVGKK